jgi:hypothetical protein
MRSVGHEPNQHRSDWQLRGRCRCCPSIAGQPVSPGANSPSTLVKPSVRRDSVPTRTTAGERKVHNARRIQRWRLLDRAIHPLLTVDTLKRAHAAYSTGRSSMIQLLAVPFRKIHLGSLPVTRKSITTFRPGGSCVDQCSHLAPRDEPCAMHVALPRPNAILKQR